VNNHYKSHPDFIESGGLQDFVERDPDVIDQDLLRKYLEYAKHNVTPRLQQMDQDKLAQVYSSLRKESLNYGSIPLTVRHVESMIRMAEAHARMHLRDYVIQDDLDVSIQTMLNSFLQANKSSVGKLLKKKFSKFLTLKGEYNELLHHLLHQLANAHYRLILLEINSVRRGNDDDVDLLVEKVEFDADEFELKAREFNINDVTNFYHSPVFSKAGYSLEERVDDKGRRRRLIVRKIQ
jgi:DNA replication licensing factor MCM2